MTFQIRLALGLAAAVMFSNMAFAPIASAQDVMQLDLMFRDSLLRRPVPEELTRTKQGQANHGRRQHIDATQEPAKMVRRHPRRHRKT